MFATFTLKGLISVSILDNLHNFNLRLVGELVDFLFEFGLIHKIIVILHWKVPFLDYLYLFIFIKTVRLFIDVYSPIFIDDWFNMDFLNMIGNVRIICSAHHTIDMFLYLNFLWSFAKIIRFMLIL